MNERNEQGERKVKLSTCNNQSKTLHCGNELNIYLEVSCEKCS